MKVLVKCVAGSHLFGTNTENSDKDYKGVYIPDADSILLGNYKDSKQYTTGDENSKNSKEDIDVELYSIRKFFKMLKNGDTAAIELLFTPEELIIEKDPLWDEIVKHRDDFLTSKVTGMIGYARQQAHKYGIKGSRMGELNNIITKLKEIEKLFSFANPKLKHAWLDVVQAVDGFDHVHIIELEVSKNMQNVTVPALDILGKKFDHHCTFPYVLGILKKVYNNYGQRAREAKKNNGIDWKALSHAARVMFQGQELLEHGYVTLPLKPEERDIVMKIKKGEMDYKLVAPIIEKGLEDLEKAKDNTSLAKEFNSDLANKIILKLHKKVIDELEVN